MATTIIDVNVPSDLVLSLLDGGLVAYHDDQYEMTTGRNELLMKLFRDGDRLVVFYLQVPYAYPMPDGIKLALQKSFEQALNKTIPPLEFVNAGTEAQKREDRF